MPSRKARNELEPGRESKQCAQTTKLAKQLLSELAKKATENGMHLHLMGQMVENTEAGFEHKPNLKTENTKLTGKALEGENQLASHLIFNVYSRGNLNSTSKSTR